MENYSTTSDSSSENSDGSIHKHGHQMLDFSRMSLDADTMTRLFEDLTTTSSAAAAAAAQVVQAPETSDAWERRCFRPSRPPRSCSRLQLLLHHNEMLDWPALNLLPHCHTIDTIDISNNQLTRIPDLGHICPQLRKLIAKNNHFNDKSLEDCSTLHQLKELNLSGNQFEHIPHQILDHAALKYLYMGGNQIESIPSDIWKLERLQVLSIGGNRLRQVPPSIGQLRHLHALTLCNNAIESLPADIANLHELRSLLLHSNLLRTLPTQLLALRKLSELSLRDNPLVVRFISHMELNPATLLELAGRAIQVQLQQHQRPPLRNGDLPHTLLQYLQSAHHCLNPKCKGVYFESRVEHVKFVDFCGKYRIPLLQYLCSAKCAESDTDNDYSSLNNSQDHDTRRISTSQPSTHRYLMKKVLLG